MSGRGRVAPCSCDASMCSACLSRVKSQGSRMTLSAMWWLRPPKTRPLVYGSQRCAHHVYAWCVTPAALTMQLMSRLHKCRKGTSTSIKAHAAGVQSVDFSTDGRFLLTAGDDKAVKVSRPVTLRMLVSKDVAHGCCQCFGRSGTCQGCSS